MPRPTPKPIVLIVRDGWGSNPHPEWNHANAIHLARTPVADRLMAAYPHVLIKTSGEDVGLPAGVMGNSEVGHQNIGAGRVVEQEIMRITNRIRDGSFFENSALEEAFDRAQRGQRHLHIMGLVSNGRVHSDVEHFFGMMEMTRRRRFPGERVFVHAFTDGRDTPPQSGLHFIKEMESKCREFGINPVASVIGRYYAMDRDHRWERTEKAYRMLTEGVGDRFASSTEAVQHYYDHPTEPSRTGDEFITPSVVPRSDGSVATIQDGDSVIFCNFRGDRPRQLTKAFVQDSFPYPGEVQNGPQAGFPRPHKLDVLFVTLTEFEEGLPVCVAFDKPRKMADILGAYVADRGLSQFRCAETEKYPHVTYFFNDYRNEPFPREDRELVPSPRDVSTYDQKPEMSALQVAEATLRRLATHEDALLVINFANGDMVGHTGNLRAAVKAVETVDACVGRIVDAVREKGGGLIVTADHGNCEQMIDPETGGPHTAHTTYDVELIVADERYKNRRLRTGGRLADIAPTLLAMMGLPEPDVMTGDSLLIDE